MLVVDKVHPFAVQPLAHDIGQIAERQNIRVLVKGFAVCKAQPFAGAHLFQNVAESGLFYTIIEFIFKKTASDFYQIVKEKNTFFDEIFLLSGTILEHRRKEIINFLKNKIRIARLSRNPDR